MMAIQILRKASEIVTKIIIDLWMTYDSMSPILMTNDQFLLRYSWSEIKEKE